jgi:hypothetical protein
MPGERKDAIGETQDPEFDHLDLLLFASLRLPCDFSSNSDSGSDSTAATAKGSVAARSPLPWPIADADEWRPLDEAAQATCLAEIAVALGSVRSIEGAPFVKGRLERIGEVYPRGLRRLQSPHHKDDPGPSRPSRAQHAIAR